MVELMHRQPEPPILQNYRENHPNALPVDFDSLPFRPIKLETKRNLNEDQFGLCAYCESALLPNEGHIDHIKPKGGPNAHPTLAFVYTNYAHSCSVSPKHCGQRKQAGLLPIEPGPNCNRRFAIVTNGSIDAALINSTNQTRHQVRQTRDMLGLNQPSLIRERERWINNSLMLLKESAELFESFIADKPYRFILRQLLA